MSLPVSSLFALVCFCMLAPCSVRAAQLDVCTSCTYINISSAIAASVSGDIINITAGIYTEPMSTINAGVALTLLATDGLVTVFTTSSYYRTWLYIYGYVTINGQFALPGGTITVQGTLNQYGTFTSIPSIRAWYIYYGQFNQYGVLNITITVAGVTGVPIENGVWTQHGEALFFINTASAGVIFADTPSSIWYQYGAVNMNLQGGSTGVYVSTSALWSAMGNTTLNIDSGSLGISCEGFWVQEGDLILAVSGSGSVGVNFAITGGVWTQNGSVSTLISGDTVKGIYFTTVGAVWNQHGRISILMNASSSCGVDFLQGYTAQWRQLGPVPIFTVSGHDSYSLCPPPLPVPLNEPIQFNFSLSTPAVTLTQTDNATREGEVHYAFLALQEILPNDTVVQRVSLQDAAWVMGSYSKYTASTTIGRTTAYNYTTILPNHAVLEYSFLSTSSGSATVILANNDTVALDPRFLKFSIWLSFWNWTAPDSRLQLSMGVLPVFNHSEQRPNSPDLGVTTLFLQSADPFQASAFVELLDFALVGPEATSVMCSIGTDVNTSSFTMTFSHFGNSSLYYDPALSLLLGQAQSSSVGDESSGDGISNTLIIIISVVVPIALLTVPVVIFIVFSVALARYLQARYRKGGMVNFTAGDLLRPDDGIENKTL